MISPALTPLGAARLPSSYLPATICAGDLGSLLVVESVGGKRRRDPVLCVDVKSDLANLPHVSRRSLSDALE